MAERTYRVQVAAELSGVRLEAIRAWERRYGLLVPRRTALGHRMYTERDVVLLRRLKQLTEAGVPIREVTARLPRLLRELDTVPLGLTVNPVLIECWRSQALAAAEALDPERLSAVLDEVLSVLPPVTAYDEVMVPLAFEVGERWHEGRFTVGQEHLVTQQLRERLIGLLRAAPCGARRRTVLACFPSEEHELGLLGTALRLRYADVSVTLLGQKVPAGEVGQVAVRQKADLVGLSVVMDPGAASLEQTLVRVRKSLPRGTVVWVGGPAARKHRALCQELGASVFESAADWERLLA